ncbi:MAG: hypothetical protein CM1200mP36_00880 [Gammaproteobacteria bacterium]|nr:MAG: hypothetical protein CM1200mP36_00880 [Gammaproteobacteria bacterium]
MLVGINTGRSNALVAEALARGLIPTLEGFGRIRREVKVEGTRSRIVFLLSEHPQEPDCYLEVKNFYCGVQRRLRFLPGRRECARDWARGGVSGVCGARAGGERFVFVSSG